MEEWQPPQKNRPRLGYCGYHDLPWSLWSILQQTARAATTRTTKRRAMIPRPRRKAKPNVVCSDRWNVVAFPSPLPRAMCGPPRLDPPFPAVSSAQLHRVLQSSGTAAAALSSNFKETTKNGKHDSSSSAEVARSPSQQTLRNIAKKAMTLSSRRLSSPRLTPAPPPPSNDVERDDIGSGVPSDRGPNDVATISSTFHSMRKLPPAPQTQPKHRQTSSKAFALPELMSETNNNNNPSSINNHPSTTTTAADGSLLQKPELTKDSSLPIAPTERTSSRGKDDDLLQLLRNNSGDKAVLQPLNAPVSQDVKADRNGEKEPLIVTTQLSTDTYGSSNDDANFEETSRHGSATTPRIPRIRRQSTLQTRWKRWKRRFLARWLDPCRVLQALLSILCKAYFALISIPIFILSIVLYRYLDNPTLAFLPGQNVPLAWWLNFIGRLLFTLDLARLWQWLCVDHVLVGTHTAAKILGPLTTLYAIQGRGWPFVVVTWALIK